MVGVVCRVEAHPVFAFLVLKGLRPSAEVIIERLAGQSLIGVWGVSHSGVGGRSACRLAVFTNWTLPRVFVVVAALFNHRLQAHIRLSMAAETKFLDHDIWQATNIA